MALVIQNTLFLFYTNELTAFYIALSSSILAAAASRSPYYCLLTLILPFTIRVYYRIIHPSFIFSIYKEIISESSFILKATFLNHFLRLYVRRSDRDLYLIKADLIEAVSDNLFCCFRRITLTVFLLRHYQNNICLPFYSRNSIH